MPEEHFKEVLFFRYCKMCKHFHKKEDEDPCYDCLKDHHNPDSHRPTYFEEADKK